MHYFLRLTILSLLLALGTQLTAQVRFTQVPTDWQIYPRERDAGFAEAKLEGIVGGATYSECSARLFQEGILIDSSVEVLSFSGDSARFSLTLSIPVVRKNHSIEIYLDDPTTPVFRAEFIAAGDIYVINGQSNALASTAIFHTDRDTFVRGFNGPYNPGYTNFPGWTELYRAFGGIWAGRTGRIISTEQNVPIAIFNIGVGGRELAYFEPGHPSGNFDRLLEDLSTAGVLGKVHSFFWSQGEADSYNNITQQAYQSKLKALFEAYRDTTNADNFYHFQTRPLVCFSQVNFIMEAQRRLASELDYVSLLSTTNAKIFTDSCHFDYDLGYGPMGDRLADLLLFQEYGAGSPSAISPSIDSARLIDNRTIRMYVDVPGSSLAFSGDPWPDFKVEGLDLRAVSASVAQSTVDLSFDADIQLGTGLSYIPNRDTGFNYVFNQEGVGLISWENVSLFPGDGASNRLPDLALSLSSDITQPQVGNVVSISLEVLNEGGTTVTDALIQVPKPLGVRYPSFGAFDASQGEVLDTSLHWTIPMLRPGEFASLIIKYEVLSLQDPVIVFAQVLSMNQSLDYDSSPGNGETPNVAEDDEVRIVLTERSQDCALRSSLLTSDCSSDSTHLWELQFDLSDALGNDVQLLLLPSTALLSSDVMTGAVQVSIDSLVSSDTLLQGLVWYRNTGQYACRSAYGPLSPPSVCMPKEVSSTSIAHPEQDRIHVWPNPVKVSQRLVVDGLTGSSNARLVQVYDFAGRLQFVGSPQGFTVPALTPGLYAGVVDGRVFRFTVVE